MQVTSHFTNEHETFLMCLIYSYILCFNEATMDGSYYLNTLRADGRHERPQLTKFYHRISVLRSAVSQFCHSMRTSHVTLHCLLQFLICVCLTSITVTVRALHNALKMFSEGTQSLLYNSDTIKDYVTLQEHQ